MHEYTCETRLATKAGATDVLGNASKHQHHTAYRVGANCRRGAKQLQGRCPSRISRPPTKLEKGC